MASQVGRDVGLRESLVDASGARLRQHLGRQVDAVDALGQAFQLHAAQPGAATEIQRMRETPLAGHLAQLAHQHLVPAIVQHLQQMRVELAGVVVEEPLHVVARRRFRCRTVFDRGQTEFDHLGVAAVRQRLPVRHRGLDVAARLAQDAAAVDPRLGLRGIERQRALVRLQRPRGLCSACNVCPWRNHAAPLAASLASKRSNTASARACWRDSLSMQPRWKRAGWQPSSSASARSKLATDSASRPSVANARPRWHHASGWPASSAID